MCSLAEVQKLLHLRKADANIASRYILYCGVHSKELYMFQYYSMNLDLGCLLFRFPALKTFTMIVKVLYEKLPLICTQSVKVEFCKSSQLVGPPQ